MRTLTILLLIIFSYLIISCDQTKPLSEFEVKTEKIDTEKQTEEYYSDNHIQYTDHCYDKNIKSIILQNSSWELSAPIIDLNNNESVLLKFDQIGTDFKQYQYKLIHCTAEWNPSDLLDNEYIEGYYTDLINDYEYSFNTFVPYIHYKLEVPNEGMRLIKSGNYLLMVYEDEQQIRPVLTRRFLVYDTKLVITAEVKKPAIVEYRDFKQQINFRIDYDQFEINNPFRDLKIVVRQNDRWDNAIYGLQPSYIRDKSLIYNSEIGNDFWGGNEFRSFDIKSLRYVTEEVQSIRKNDQSFLVELVPDKKRNIARYFTDPDINGKFLTKNDDGFDQFVGSEYVDVKFTLDYEQPLNEGNIYVFGALSDQQYTSDYQMHYNYTTKSYELTLLLKQGYYNYLYAYVADGFSEADHTFIEGTHFETENDYTIQVYFRDITTDYDQLIGINTFNSTRGY